MANDPLKTILRKGSLRSDTQYWLTWHHYLDVCLTPVHEDVHDRLYWSAAITGELDVPRYKPWTEIQTEWNVDDGEGHTIYCDGPSWKLGVPPPESAPTVPAVAYGPAIVTEARDYILTWGGGSGESCASDPIAVTANVGYPVTINDIPVDAAPPGATHVNVYRKRDTETEYRLVGRGNINKVTFVDNALTDEDLGSGMNPALLSCTLGSYDAPTVEADAPLAGTGATSTVYYSFALYKKTPTETNIGGEGGSVWLDPYVAGWLPLSGDSSVRYDVVSATVGTKQQVTLTLPRNANGTYNYATAPGSPGFGAYDVGMQSDYAWLVLRSTTYPSDPLGWEVVAIESPYLTSNPNPHTVTVPAKETDTTYYTPLSAYPTSAVSPSAPGISYWLPWTPGGFQGTTDVVDADVASADSAEAFYRRYALTYIISGEETQRSQDSEEVLVNDGQQVDLTLPTAPVGATSVNIYRMSRTQSGSFPATSEYKLVVTLSAATGSYSDTTLEESLTTKIPDASMVVEYAGPDVAGVTGEAQEPPEEIPESRSYIYTYVTAYGEEGPPSPPSEIVTVYPNATVDVRDLLPYLEGDRNIQKIRIYRSSTGTNLTAFQFVAEIDNGKTAYLDSILPKDLGEVIPSIWYYPPPEGGISMCLMANGIMLLAEDKTLYPSESFLPHAYNPNYTLTTEREIVGMATFGQSAAILTLAYPYILTGVDPSSLTLQKLEIPQACASKRSIVSTGDGVIYASPDGLIMLSQGGVKNLTQGLIHRDQWQAYNPWTMHCNIYNNRIFVFHDTGLLIFDFSGESAVMVKSVEEGISTYYDPIQDALFYAKYNPTDSTEDGIYKWNAGELVPYIWRSKVFQLPKPTSFAWAQVEADSYPLTCKVYNGNSANPLYTRTVTSREPFRLPSGSVHRDWYIQLEGTATIFQAALSERMNELQEL